MWATGTGSDVWKRIAAPMVGGIFTSFVLELVVYPAIYEIWKWHFEMKRAYAEPPPGALPSPEAARERTYKALDERPWAATCGTGQSGAGELPGAEARCAGGGSLKLVQVPLSDTMLLSGSTAKLSIT
jgi:hypothetical protein